MEKGSRIAWRSCYLSDCRRNDWKRSQEGEEKARKGRRRSTILRILEGLSEKPSYEIRSQPRIANIDYACYVLGAIGT